MPVNLTAPAWLERGDSAAARKLIDLQLAATPDTVAAPVDVLEVTAAGARWVGREHNSECAAP